MKYTRKTIDQWEVQGNYGSGWESVTIEDTRKAAREMLKCYNENETGTPHRIVKKRIKIEQI